jgi:hypothetical protein
MKRSESEPLGCLFHFQGGLPVASQTILKRCCRSCKKHSGDKQTHNTGQKERERQLLGGFVERAYIFSAVKTNGRDMLLLLMERSTAFTVFASNVRGRFIAEVFMVMFERLNANSMGGSVSKRMKISSFSPSCVSIVSETSSLRSASKISRICARSSHLGVEDDEELAFAFASEEVEEVVEIATQRRAGNTTTRTKIICFQFITPHRAAAYL